MRQKIIVLILLAIATAITVIFLYSFKQWNPAHIRSLIQSAGWIAPVVYILLYSLSTFFLMPSTPLNRMGGILFGLWWGTLWTSVAAFLVAIVSFALTRELAADWVQRRFGHHWRSLDRELQDGGIPYLFALRLLPILPYGLVNFGAGFTSIRYVDYIIGTLLGTVPGIFPFIWLGSLGFQAVHSGEVLPLILPLGLIGVLVGGATWYQRHKPQP